MDPISYVAKYSPIGDIIVIATCLVFAVLLRISYVKRTYNYTILNGILFLVTLAGSANVVYYLLMTHYTPGVSDWAIYLCRAINHIALGGNLYLYLMYLREPMRLDEDMEKVYLRLAMAVMVLLILFEVVSAPLHIGFYIDEKGIVHPGIYGFMITYVVLMVILLIQLIRFRKRVYKQVMVGITGCIAVSVGVMLVQVFSGQSSYTVSTFVFPLIAIIYMAHSNPYDIELGAVGLSAFIDHVGYVHSRGKPIFVMELILPDFERPDGIYPEEVRERIKRFSALFQNNTLFEIARGRFILTADLESNPDYLERATGVQDLIKRTYPVHKYDYKIIYGVTVEDLEGYESYLGLLKYVEDRMGINQVKGFSSDDIKAFREHRYIIRELQDIKTHMDLMDERVEVFCQPVKNTFTDQYDTAEALMRLRLPELGMVFPDRFIPIAEKYGFITSLGYIILSKTCAQVKAFIDEGYHVERMSVNFSMIDIRDDAFCDNVKNIISKSGVPFGKIAIELTESQNEKDFMLVKEKVNELKEVGIKFYLDDFGTGYSNFERIMQLPIDIIKFDRSLVIASARSVRSETMVSYLAHMFSDMNYAVLYEGIEDDSDESRCLNMCARYLQGYKYSKPIPIIQLCEFFAKA